MPDDLYERDILEWAEQQAALLRRAARGERVNDIDWEHVVEEIEDVGISELSAVRSLLSQLLIHLLKLQGWPGCMAREHWRNELAVFQADAADRFVPSMRQRLDVPALYQRAHRLVSRMRIDDAPPALLPQACPYSLDDLLSADVDALVARLGSEPGPQG